MYAGCWVLALVIFLEGFSAFGRTSALSPFLKSLCGDLSLSMTQITGAYSFANIVAGFLLPYVGYGYHRQRASRFMMIFVLLFSASLLGWSQLSYRSSIVNFGCMGLLFTGIRLSVQAYRIVEKSMIAVWFSKRRGWATGCSELILTLFLSVTPSICYSLSQQMTWRTFTQLLGFLWLLWFPFCFVIRKPSDIGASSQQPLSGREVQPSRLWFFLLFTLFWKNFQNSGIAFHLVSLCHEFQVDPKRISIAFIPIATEAVLVTFVLGHFFSQIGSKRSLWVFLVSNIGMLVAIQKFSSPGMINLFIACTGMYWGINNVIATMVIPELFGISTISIRQGWVYSAATLGSALGPFYFGVMKDFLSYQTGLQICTAIVCWLCFMFLKIQKNIPCSQA